MILRSIHRHLMISLCGLLLLALGIAVIAYQVSPLRDPTFVPNSANAGATLNWLTPEKHWITMAHIFAGALATNIAMLVRSWLVRRGSTVQSIRKRPSSTWSKIFRTFRLWFGLFVLWIIVFGVAWYSALLFLLAQWIVD